jgi:hypothetical protein
MFTQYFIVFCFVCFFTLGNAFADSIEEIEKTLEKYTIDYQERSYFWNTFEISVTELDESLRGNFPDVSIEYIWEVFSNEPQSGTTLSTTFETVGEKTIELNVFANISETDEEGNEVINKKLLYSYDESVFVYEKSIPVLTSNTMDNDALADYIEAWEDLWVYIYQIWTVSEQELIWEDIINSLSEYKISFPENSDYLAIWWEKEFLFSALSQIRRADIENQSLNIVLISSYNTTILKKYIANAVAWKSFIKDGFIIDESLKFQTLKNPQNIINLKKEVETNNYSYTPITENIDISPIFFMSRFINDLSNNWVSTTHIYIILLLPLFLTVIGISKHLIGISTLWSIIPVFITLLYLQIGVAFTLVLIWFLIVCNIGISKFISKYTLLYTPKVTFITILNLLIFMLFYQGLQYLEIMTIDISNILYIILFFIVSEKLITIITSKEFREYKKSLIGTLIVSLLCYWLFNFNTLLVFLTAYPETLILLVPLNFLLGRFTWLRITEYLRFREIVKSIEE